MTVFCGLYIYWRCILRIRMMPSWHPWGIFKIQDGRKKIRTLIFSSLTFEKVNTLKDQNIILCIFWTFWKKKSIMSELRPFSIYMKTLKNQFFLNISKNIDICILHIYKISLHIYCMFLCSKQSYIAQ